MKSIDDEDVDDLSNEELETTSPKVNTTSPNKRCLDKLNYVLNLLHNYDVYYSQYQ